MAKPEFVDVLTRDLHDLAQSLSVMRRTNGGMYAPTPLKKKHKNSSSVEPGPSQALPKILLRARHNHVYRIMQTIPAFLGQHFSISMQCMCSFGGGGRGFQLKRTSFV